MLQLPRIKALRPEGLESFGPEFLNFEGLPLRQVFFFARSVLSYTAMGVANDQFAISSATRRVDAICIIILSFRLSGSADEGVGAR